MRHQESNLLLTSVMLVLAISASPVPASAQARLEARYSATVAGIPIGTGSWASMSNTQYSATVNGATSGFAARVHRWPGTATARGTMSAGRLSSIYAGSMSAATRVRLNPHHHHQRQREGVQVDPPADNDPNRVPITEASQRGVLDPMTAALVHVPGNGDPLVPEACQRTRKSSARLRYDMQFSFKRMDRVKAIKAILAPWWFARPTSAPIAGFIPRARRSDIWPSSAIWRVWLAPIAGTRVLVPFRAQGPTPIGQAIVEASNSFQFNQAGASANGSKTQ